VFGAKGSTPRVPESMMEKERELPGPDFYKWAIEYGLDGKRWELHVMATDAEDAMRRVRQAAAFGEVAGRELFSMKIAPDWTLPLVRFVKSKLSR
jgi:hypothetical protein